MTTTVASLSVTLEPDNNWTVVTVRRQDCYDLRHVSFHIPYLPHYLTCADPMTHTDSRFMTHRLLIVPYDITTDITMMHADSRLLIHLRYHDSY